MKVLMCHKVIMKSITLLSVIPFFKLPRFATSPKFRRTIVRTFPTYRKICRKSKRTFNKLLLLQGLQLLLNELDKVRSAIVRAQVQLLAEFAAVKLDFGVLALKSENGRGKLEAG